MSAYHQKITLCSASLLESSVELSLCLDYVYLPLPLGYPHVSTSQQTSESNAVVWFSLPFAMILVIFLRSWALLLAASSAVRAGLEEGLQRGPWKSPDTIGTYHSSTIYLRNGLYRQATSPRPASISSPPKLVADRKSRFESAPLTNITYSNLLRNKWMPKQFLFLLFLPSSVRLTVRLKIYFFVILCSIMLLNILLPCRGVAILKHRSGDNTVINTNRLGTNTKTSTSKCRL